MGHSSGHHGSKRGLVARFCNHTALFTARARRWQYNHGHSLVQFGHFEWHSDPACRALTQDTEYAPMVYSLSALAQLASAPPSAFAPARHSKYLLGLNEPSPLKNESAAEVAARWPAMEKLAARSTPPLKLVSPAPGGLNLKRGEQWLHDFFAACTSCRVDAIAVHFYECNGSTTASATAAADALMAFLDRVYKRYHKPLWLTEWNCGDGSPPNPLANQSASSHLRFMRAALPRLDAARHVARYSWFQAWQRHTPRHPGQNPGCSLISRDGRELTELGRLYDSSFDV